MSKRMSLATVVTLIPLMATAGMIGSDLFLISVGRGPGANDSYWYTTVWIHNPGDVSSRVTVSLLRRDQPNTSPEQQILTVSPGETLKIGDVLWDLYGEEEASGALRFAADRRIVVSSRIYNLPGSDPAESQGQFMAGIPAELAVGLGNATDIPGITQPADDSFRCNFAMVETSGNQAIVEVTLVDGGGLSLASRSFTLRPFEPAQRNLSHLGGEAIVDGGRLNVAVTGGSGRVLALASMVGNGVVSQDPSTLEMEIAMPEGGSVGDITAVYAGEGLAGGGASGDVTLGIDIAGASPGQALVYDGAHVGWDSPPGGLTLPYSGAQATTGPTFNVTNTSTTGNVFGIRGENQSTAGAGVYGWSSSSSGATSGVVGQAASPSGTGVFGLAESGSGAALGVVGATLSSDGAGVVAFGAGDGADLIVGGTGSGDSADNGVIASDPRYASSDLHLRSNHDVLIQLDADGDETDQRLAVVDHHGDPLFEVDSEGLLRQAAGQYGLMKSAAVIRCGTSPGVNTSWSVYGTWPQVVATGGLGKCRIRFGFPYWDINVIASANEPALFTKCKRYAGYEVDEIECEVFDTDGQPHETHEGGSWITVRVF